MSSQRQFLAMGVTLGLVLGLLVGAGAVVAQGPSASQSSAVAVPPTKVETGPVGAPTVTTATSGSATAGTAVAYPYWGGSPGLAPDNTIVVTGVGQADLSSDGANRAAAQKSAIAAAIADARAQADAVASATGLSISGVLSVSVSVSPNYGVVPMAGSGTLVCPPVAYNGGSGQGGAPVPQPVCPPAYLQTLSASATVAYRVG